MPVYAYYHNDHLGTPLALSDEQGQVVAEWVRDPFGNVVSKSGTIEDNHMFPGQFWDADANLAYNWNRWYAPEVGRYVEADPVVGILIRAHRSNALKFWSIADNVKRYELEGRMPPYLYAGNNPLIYSDRRGLLPSRAWCEQQAQKDDLVFDIENSLLMDCYSYIRRYFDDCKCNKTITLWVAVDCYEGGYSNWYRNPNYAKSERNYEITCSCD